MRNFTTIFTPCENVHLTKDLGQIPYYMNKMYGFDARLVCYKNSEYYDNLNGEVKGLRLEFIPNTGRISFLEKSVLKYIYRNARRIDVLNLYLFSKFTFVYGILYKIRNLKGFLFLKLDGYNETFSEGAQLRHSQMPWKNFLLKRAERVFLKKVDFISIENSAGEELVRKKFPHIRNKIMFLPVGVNDQYISSVLGGELRSFAQKENIILTVGRIGEPIKNHEMLLQALPGINLDGWKVALVGPVNPDFESRLGKFLAEHPHLKDKIILTGNIADRKTLYEWYDRSKIFCMTSIRESFCHAIAEAFYFGNYIVGTEGIMSMKDISADGKYGSIVRENDAPGLASVLNGLIANE